MSARIAHQRLGTLACYGLGIAVGVVLAFKAGETLAVHYEVWSTGASSVEDLGDDLGLGVLLFMVTGPAVVIGAALGAGATWMLRRALNRWIKPGASGQHAA